MRTKWSDLPILSCRWCFVALLFNLLLSEVASAQQNPDGRLSLGQYDDPLVFLLRDEEVHRELDLTKSQRSQLQELSEQADQLIWPARNKSAEEGGQAWGRATELARSRGRETLNDRQWKRIQQIILWIQGTRSLLHEDVANHLQLSRTQREAIRKSAESSLRELEALRQRAQAGENSETFEKQSQQIFEEDQRRVVKQLSEEQKRSWLVLLGPRIDTRKLGKVTFRAPALQAESDHWLNQGSNPTSLAGKVAVVHFFANGCINCIRNYEHYRDWEETFRGQDLLIVGIHTPETEGERDVARLRSKVAEAGFQFPILIDNDKRNWHAWGNSMWPSVYLVDHRGRIRYWWYGELNWQGANGQERLKQRITELLAEAGHHR